LECATALIVPGGTVSPAAADMDTPLELLIMPGLGFDLHGRRLGRGGG